MKKTGLFYFEDTKQISLDSIEIEVRAVNESKLLLNGFFPELIERVLVQSEKTILFFSPQYLHLAYENWPVHKNRFEIQSLNLNCDHNNLEKFDAVIYEGHVNCFSGIDVSSYLMRSLVEKEVVPNAYFVCHPETRLYPPLRFTSDFDQHLHHAQVPWEKFFVDCTRWVSKDRVLTIAEVEKIKCKNPLIINCSISYQQPVWDFSSMLIGMGAKAFLSDRNVHTSLFRNGPVKTFAAERLLNYSPFEPDSPFSKSIRAWLKLQLGEFLNVKLD